MFSDKILSHMQILANAWCICLYTVKMLNKKPQWISYLFHRKRNLQDHALLVKLSNKNVDSPLEALQRFQTLKNIHRHTMTANRTFSDHMDSISYHALSISKNLLYMTDKHAILRFQIILDNNGRFTETCLNKSLLQCINLYIFTFFSYYVFCILLFRHITNFILFWWIILIIESCEFVDFNYVHLIFLKFLCFSIFKKLKILINNCQ